MYWGARLLALVTLSLETLVTLFLALVTQEKREKEERELAAHRERERIRAGGGARGWGTHYDRLHHITI